MAVTWLFILHPNTFMTYLCLLSIPIHGTVGGTVHWISMLSGVVCSSFWGMSAAFETQLNDPRRSSQLGMVVAAGQGFLVQANILSMQRVLSNRAHMTLLAGFFSFHGLRYSALKQRREIDNDVAVIDEQPEGKN